MPQFDIGENALGYEARFSPPPFSLLDQTGVLVSGLYHAFLGMHSGLDSFTVEEQTENALAPGIAVALGERGTYTFRFDYIQWDLPQAWSWEWDPSPLTRGDAWLRTVAPSIVYQSQVFTYEAHGLLVNSNAGDYLLSLGSPALAGMGANAGTGLIFHMSYTDHSWYVHLMIDHSHVLPGGLFVQMVTTILGNQTAHEAMVKGIRNIFQNSLTQLGLEIITGVG